MLLFKFGGKIPRCLCDFFEADPPPPPPADKRLQASGEGTRGGAGLELQGHVQQSISVSGTAACSKAILRCKVKAA